ncbi:MAG: UrcA family protein [Pseudomonadota bacterium]
MTKTIFAPATAFALALTSVANPASAGTSAPGVAVSVADLDLRTSQGRQTLDTRLRLAVRKVCAPARLPGVKAWASYRKCIARTTNDIADQRDKLVADAQTDRARARADLRTR